MPLLIHHPRLLAIRLPYNLFYAPTHVHAATPVQTQPGWPLRSGYLCGAGHWGYYIRLLSQKIILPCGSAGLFFVYLSDGFAGRYTERKKETAQIHLFLTHPSVLLIKTTRSRWSRTCACSRKHLIAELRNTFSAPFSAEHAGSNWLDPQQHLKTFTGLLLVSVLCCRTGLCLAWEMVSSREPHLVFECSGFISCIYTARLQWGFLLQLEDCGSSLSANGVITMW